jgi:MFS family permease
MTTVNIEPSPGRSDAVPASGIRTFVFLWLAQWLTVFAAALTVLVLGLNIYEEFDSVWVFVLAYTVLFVPLPILSPIEGALVDRWGQRRALLVSNVGILAITTALLVLMLTDTAGLWAIIAILAINAVLRGLQLAALESAVPLLVPKRHLMRANGPRMLLTTTGIILGPLVIALLLLVVEPVVIIAMECAAMTLTILVVRTLDIPVTPRPDGDAAPGSLRTEVRSAWDRLRSRHGLMPMLWFLAGISAVIALLERVGGENVYAFAGEGGTIVVFLVGYVGLLITSIAMTIWGLPRRLARGMLGAGLAMAGALVLGALRPNVVTVAVAAFIFLGGSGIVVGAVQTVLHTKVEPHRLGFAIGVKNAMIPGGHIVGNVIALASGATLVPLIGQNRVRWPAVSAFVGDGPGRGWALLMMAGGVVAALIVFLAYRSLRLRRVQDDLPDVTPEDRPAEAAPAAPVASGPVEVVAPAPARR